MRKIFYGFLIFMAAALVSIPFINWQSLKQPILNKVQTMTGYEIEIKGPVKIQFFPTPKIILDDTSLRPTNQKIGTDSLQLVSARAKEIRLGWSWAPLLKGKFDIHHFDLDAPIIILKSVKAPKLSETEQATPTKTPSKSSNFSLHHFAIKSGKVVIDADTPKQTRIDDVTISGFIKGIKGPAEVKGNLVYNDIKFGFQVTALESTQTTPLKGSITVGYKGQTFGPLSFDGVVNMQDKKHFKTHMILGYEGNTAALDSGTDFEKDQTELVVTSKKINYQNHYLSNLTAALKIKGSEVFFNKVEGEIYEGKLDISGHLQENKKMILQGHLHQLNLTKIPELHESPVKKGRLEAFTKLALDLNNSEKCLETLSGTLTMNVTEGALETIDIESLTQQIKKIKDPQSLIQGLEIAKKQRILDIQKLKADFKINNGIATTHNLEIAADTVNIKGQGDIDVVRSLLDLALNVYAKPLGNLFIPFKITGSWSSPSYGIDQEQMGSIITKNLTEKGVDAVMGQIRKKAEEALGKGTPSTHNNSDQTVKPEKVIKEVLSGLLR